MLANIAKQAGNKHDNKSDVSDHTSKVRTCNPHLLSERLVVEARVETANVWKVESYGRGQGVVLCAFVDESID
jgi:hypothetical protein